LFVIVAKFSEGRSGGRPLTRTVIVRWFGQEREWLIVVKSVKQRSRTNLIARIRRMWAFGQRKIRPKTRTSNWFWKVAKLIVSWNIFWDSTIHALTS